MGLTSAQGEQYASLITLGVAATIAVILRFLARARSKASFGLDDYFSLIALLFYLVYVGVSLWGATTGHVGANPTKLPLPVLKIGLKVFYIDTFFAVLTISFAKFSVLSLYYRVFSVRRGFRTALIIMGVACIFWMVACILMAIWRCVPVQAALNPLIKGKCYDFQLAFLVSESVNCVMDFLIVCMPIGIIRQLQLPTRHKISVSLIFFMGGFVCITSIIRIIFTYQTKTTPYAILNSALWTTIQLSFAIICACLPTYRPILPKGTLFTTSFRRLYSTFRSSNGRVSGSYPSAVELQKQTDSSSRPWPGRYQKFDDGLFETTTLTDIEAVDEHSLRGVYPNDAIAVRSDVHVI